MGMVISHGCYNGSYGQWHEFIKQIAKTINICLPLMEGFYKPLETIMDREEKQILSTLIVQEMIRTARIPQLPYKWEWYPIDPLYELFLFADGKLLKEHHIILVNRLNRLLYESANQLQDWHVNLINNLLAGLIFAASKNEDIVIQG